MTDAHSRVNGGGRHECDRGGARGRRTGAVRGQSGGSQRRQRRCARTRYGDRADHDHASGFAVRALVNVEIGHAQPERLDGFGFRRLGW